MNCLKDMTYFTKTLFFIGLVFVFSSCTFEEDNTLIYDESTIIERRKELADFFKNDPSSPLKEIQKEGFTAMQYFPPSEDYAFYADFTLISKPDTVQLLTSKPYYTWYDYLTQARKYPYEYGYPSYRYPSYGYPSYGNSSYGYPSYDYPSYGYPRYEYSLYRYPYYNYYNPVLF